MSLDSCPAKERLDLARTSPDIIMCVIQILNLLLNVDGQFNPLALSTYAGSVNAAWLHKGLSACMMTQVAARWEQTW